MFMVSSNSKVRSDRIDEQQKQLTSIVGDPVGAFDGDELGLDVGCV